MPGWRRSGWAQSGPILGILIFGATSLLVSHSHAATSDPASRLAARLPEVFPAANIANAVGGGEPGAGVLDVTPAAAALGVQRDDIVLRVDGFALGASDWDAASAMPPAGSAQPTLTVWRAVSGTRQVQAPDAIGHEVLSEFVALPTDERTPMRLAVMLANQATVVQQGAGVALLPADSQFDTARWLRGANPLPPESEAAVQEIATSLRRRTRMPPASGEEVAAAARDLQRGKVLEARERAQRVLVAAAREPARRAEPGGAMEEAVRVYTGANLEMQRREVLRQVPEPAFAFVVEGSGSYVDAFLPQKTQMHIDNSWGGGGQAGLRVRIAPAGVPLLSSVFLLAEIGHYRYGFDDLAGAPFLRAHLTQYTAEFMYRPHVAAQLRPYLRGGFGIFSFTGQVQCPTNWTKVIDDWETGAIFGGGIDVLRVPSLHMRASLGGTYRVLTSKFGPADAPLLQAGCGNNVGIDVHLQDGIYQFDLGGVQVGFMLTFVP